jgi:hypothetical protein
MTQRFVGRETSADRVAELQRLNQSIRAARQADRNALFGTIVAGAAVAASGGDIRDVPLTGEINLLDTLDNANAAIQQRNAEQKAAFDRQVAIDVARERQSATASTSSQSARTLSIGRTAPSPRPENTTVQAQELSRPAGPRPSSAPGIGSNPPVHLYCYRWIETTTGERTSYVSEVGAVAKTASNPAIESQTVARWRDYLAAQGIGTSGIVGCGLNTDRAYNAEGRSSFIGTARSEGTLHELAWSPS